MSMKLPLLAAVAALTLLSIALHAQPTTAFSAVPPTTPNRRFPAHYDPRSKCIVTDCTTSQRLSSRATRTTRSPYTRDLTVVHSAKILPIAYASASAALLYRATQATNSPDAAVLASVAALALFNFAPGDNQLIASAKRADEKYPPAVSGEAKARRQSAKSWRAVLRIKTGGQLLGLVRMAMAIAGGRSPTAFGSVMGGASTVMAANVAFFLAGAGGVRHDDDGTYDPMPSGASRAVCMIDAILCASALVAARSPIGSTRRAVGAGIFAAGAIIGALEGAASLVKASSSK